MAKPDGMNGAKQREEPHAVGQIIGNPVWKCDVGQERPDMAQPAENRRRNTPERAKHHHLRAAEKPVYGCPGNKRQCRHRPQTRCLHRDVAGSGFITAIKDNNSFCIVPKCVQMPLDIPSDAGSTNKKREMSVSVARPTP